MSIGNFLDGILKLLPVPKNLFELVWSGIGWTLANSFSQMNGKGLDEMIEDAVKNSKWKLGAFGSWLLHRTLHFVHHWWIAGLIMIYCGATSFYPSMPMFVCPEMLWFSVGMFIEDAGYHTAASFKNGVGNRLITWFV